MSMCSNQYSTQSNHYGNVIHTHVHTSSIFDGEVRKYFELMVASVYVVCECECDFDVLKSIDTLISRHFTEYVLYFTYLHGDLAAGDGVVSLKDPLRHGRSGGQKLHHLHRLYYVQTVQHSAVVEEPQVAIELHLYVCMVCVVRYYMLCKCCTSWYLMDNMHINIIEYSAHIICTAALTVFHSVNYTRRQHCST